MFHRFWVGFVPTLLVCGCASGNADDVGPNFGVRALADTFVGRTVFEMRRHLGPPSRSRIFSPARRLLVWDVQAPHGICVVTAEVSRLDRVDLVMTVDKVPGSGACDRGYGFASSVTRSPGSSGEVDIGGDRVKCNFGDIRGL